MCFATTAVSPWMSAGGGFGHFRPDSTWSLAGPARPSRYDDRSYADRRRARCEACSDTSACGAKLRDFWSGTPQLNVDTGKSRQHNFLVGGIWHWLVWRFVQKA